MEQFKELSPTLLDKNAFMLGKEWMLVTAEKDGKVNSMTASWGGFGIMWNKNVAFIVLRPQRYTKEFIDASDAFSLSFYNENYRQTLGYLGKVSGRDEDKVTKSGLTITHTDAIPYFEEANAVLLCKNLFAQTFEESNFIDTAILPASYPDKDYHTLYIAEVTKVLVK